MNERIPKIKKISKHSNLRNVDINNRDVQHLLRDVNKACLDTDFCQKWKAVKVSMVHNAELEANYVKKRCELKENRSSQSVKENLGFLELDSLRREKIVKEGLHVHRQPFNKLGKGDSGVCLNRYFDVELKYSLQQFKSSTEKSIFVFKFVSGKCKSITLNDIYKGECVEPTPNYDCHISSLQPKISDTMFVQKVRSSIYLYEYTEDCEPSLCPRQCLPYAVITCVLVGNPLKSLTSSFSGKKESAAGKINASQTFSPKDRIISEGADAVKSAPIKSSSLCSNTVSPDTISTSINSKPRYDRDQQHKRDELTGVRKKRFDALVVKEGEYLQRLANAQKALAKEKNEKYLDLYKVLPCPPSSSSYQPEDFLHKQTSSHLAVLGADRGMQQPLLNVAQHGPSEQERECKTNSQLQQTVNPRDPRFSKPNQTVTMSRQEQQQPHQFESDLASAFLDHEVTRRRKKPKVATFKRTNKPLPLPVCDSDGKFSTVLRGLVNGTYKEIEVSSKPSNVHQTKEETKPHKEKGLSSHKPSCESEGESIVNVKAACGQIKESNVDDLKPRKEIEGTVDMVRRDSADTAENNMDRVSSDFDSTKVHPSGMLKKQQSLSESKKNMYGAMIEEKVKKCISEKKEASGGSNVNSPKPSASTQPGIGKVPTIKGKADGRTIERKEDLGSDVNIPNPSTSTRPGIESVETIKGKADGSTNEQKEDLGSDVNSPNPSTSTLPGIERVAIIKGKADGSSNKGKEDLGSDVNIPKPSTLTRPGIESVETIKGKADGSTNEQKEDSELDINSPKPSTSVLSVSGYEREGQNCLNLLGGKSMSAADELQYFTTAHGSEEDSSSPKGEAELDALAGKSSVQSGSDSDDLSDKENRFTSAISMQDAGINCYLTALCDMNYQPDICLVDCCQAKTSSAELQDCKVCARDRNTEVLNAIKEMAQEADDDGNKGDFDDGDYDEESNTALQIDLTPASASDNDGAPSSPYALQINLSPVSSADESSSPQKANKSMAHSSLSRLNRCETVLPSSHESLDKDEKVMKGGYFNVSSKSGYSSYNHHQSQIGFGDPTCVTDSATGSSLVESGDKIWHAFASFEKENEPVTLTSENSDVHSKCVNVKFSSADSSSLSKSGSGTSTSQISGLEEGNEVKGNNSAVCEIETEKGNTEAVGLEAFKSHSYEEINRKTCGDVLNEDFELREEKGMDKNPSVIDVYDACVKKRVDDSPSLILMRKTANLFTNMERFENNAQNAHHIKDEEKCSSDEVCGDRNRDKETSSIYQKHLAYNSGKQNSLTDTTEQYSELEITRKEPQKNNSRPGDRFSEDLGNNKEATLHTEEKGERREKVKNRMLQDTTGNIFENINNIAENENKTKEKTNDNNMVKKDRKLSRSEPKNYSHCGDSKKDLNSTEMRKSAMLEARGKITKEYDKNKRKNSKTNMNEYVENKEKQESYFSELKSSSVRRTLKRKESMPDESRNDNSETIGHYAKKKCSYSLKSSAENSENKKNDSVYCEPDLGQESASSNQNRSMPLKSSENELLNSMSLMRKDQSSMDVTSDNKSKHPTQTFDIPSSCLHSRHYMQEDAKDSIFDKNTDTTSKLHDTDHDNVISSTVTSSHITPSSVVSNHADSVLYANSAHCNIYQTQHSYPFSAQELSLGDVDYRLQGFVNKISSVFPNDVPVVNSTPLSSNHFDQKMYSFGKICEYGDVDYRYGDVDYRYGSAPAPQTMKVSSSSHSTATAPQPVPVTDSLPNDASAVITMCSPLARAADEHCALSRKSAKCSLHPPQTFQTFTAESDLSQDLYGNQKFAVNMESTGKDPELRPHHQKGVKATSDSASIWTLPTSSKFSSIPGLNIDAEASSGVFDSGSKHVDHLSTDNQRDGKMNAQQELQQDMHSNNQKNLNDLLKGLQQETSTHCMDLNERKCKMIINQVLSDVSSSALATLCEAYSDPNEENLVDKQSPRSSQISSGDIHKRASDIDDANLHRGETCNRKQAEAEERFLNLCREAIETVKRQNSDQSCGESKYLDENLEGEQDTLQQGKCTDIQVQKIPYVDKLTGIMDNNWKERKTLAGNLRESCSNSFESEKEWVNKSLPDAINQASEKEWVNKSLPDAINQASSTSVLELAFSSRTARNEQKSETKGEIISLSTGHEPHSSNDRKEDVCIESDSLHQRNEKQRTLTMMRRSLSGSSSHKMGVSHDVKEQQKSCDRERNFRSVSSTFLNQGHDASNLVKERYPDCVSYSLSVSRQEEQNVSGATKSSESLMMAFNDGQLCGSGSLENLGELHFNAVPGFIKSAERISSTNCLSEIHEGRWSTRDTSASVEDKAPVAEYFTSSHVSDNLERNDVSIDEKGSLSSEHVSSQTKSKTKTISCTSKFIDNACVSKASLKPTCLTHSVSAIEGPADNECEEIFPGSRAYLERTMSSPMERSTSTGRHLSSPKSLFTEDHVPGFVQKQNVFTKTISKSDALLPYVETGLRCSSPAIISKPEEGEDKGKVSSQRNPIGSITLTVSDENDPLKQNVKPLMPAADRETFIDSPCTGSTREVAEEYSCNDSDQTCVDQPAMKSDNSCMDIQEKNMNTEETEPENEIPNENGKVLLSDVPMEALSLARHFLLDQLDLLKEPDEGQSSPSVLSKDGEITEDTVEDGLITESALSDISSDSESPQIITAHSENKKLITENSGRHQMVSKYPVVGNKMRDNIIITLSSQSDNDSTPKLQGKLKDRNVFRDRITEKEIVISSDSEAEYIVNTAQRKVKLKTSSEAPIPDQTEGRNVLGRDYIRISDGNTSSHSSPTSLYKYIVPKLPSTNDDEKTSKVSCPEGSSPFSDLASHDKIQSTSSSSLGSCHNKKKIDSSSQNRRHHNRYCQNSASPATGDPKKVYSDSSSDSRCINQRRKSSTFQSYSSRYNERSNSSSLDRPRNSSSRERESCHRKKSRSRSPDRDNRKRRPVNTPCDKRQTYSSPLHGSSVMGHEDSSALDRSSDHRDHKGSSTPDQYSNRRDRVSVSPDCSNRDRRERRSHSSDRNYHRRRNSPSPDRNYHQRRGQRSPNRCYRNKRNRKSNSPDRRSCEGRVRNSAFRENRYHESTRRNSPSPDRRNHDRTHRNSVSPERYCRDKGYRNSPFPDRGYHGAGYKRSPSPDQGFYAKTSKFLKQCKRSSAFSSSESSTSFSHKNRRWISPIKRKY